MEEEKSGEITVYCDAQSHELWERTYSRRGEDPWMPDLFDHIGGEQGDIKSPRRGGGIEYIDAAGRVVQSWDSGRVTPDDPLGKTDRLVADIDRARQVSGLDADVALPLGLRYRIRCPLCDDQVRRSGSEANKQFNWLWEQGITRISLDSLRKLDRLL